MMYTSLGPLGCRVIVMYMYLIGGGGAICDVYTCTSLVGLGFVGHVTYIYVYLCMGGDSN